jgi:hypothetical protein
MGDSDTAEREKCVRRFWSLLRHLREQPSLEEMPYFFKEIHDTARCDAFRPAFKDVREALMGSVASADSTLPSRVASVEATPADRDTLWNNYIRYRDRLARCVAAQLSTAD